MPPLDYATALQILAARGIPATCPICNQEDWQPLGPLGNLLTATPVANLDGEQVAGGGEWAVLVAFTFVCRNCGFIRQHSRRALTHFAQQADENAP